MMAGGDGQGGGGALAGLFTHVVFKLLTPVEADGGRSNQHEFNASAGLRDAFGPAQPQRLAADFVWMPDDADWCREAGVLTWYDARARHPVRSEYRLYYRDNDVTRRAGPGDLLLIARRPDGSVLVLLAPSTGPAAARLSWLFGLEILPGSGFAALSIDPTSRARLAATFGARDLPPADWETETPASPGPSRIDVLEGAREVQAKLGGTVEKYEDGDGDWGGLALSLPESAPPALSGSDLRRTISGVIGRS